MAKDRFFILFFFSKHSNNYSENEALNPGEMLNQTENWIVTKLRMWNLSLSVYSANCKLLILVLFCESEFVSTKDLSLTHLLLFVGYVYYYL